jgi:hypothetical protein
MAYTRGKPHSDRLDHAPIGVSQHIQLTTTSAIEHVHYAMVATTHNHLAVFYESDLFAGDYPRFGLEGTNTEPVFELVQTKSLTIVYHICRSTGID